MRFKFRFLALACFFLPFSGAAQADLVIVLEVESSGMPAPRRQTIKIKGNKTKTGDESFISQIRDIDSGDTILLIHQQKEYTVQSASMNKESAERAKEIMAVTPTKPEKRPKLKPTGRKQQINGFDTEEFVWEESKKKKRYWITKSLPNYALILKQIRKSFSGDRYLRKESGPEPSELRGFPIRIETEGIVETPPKAATERGRQAESEQEKTFRSVLTYISIKEIILDDAEFAIPAGYKESGSSIPVKVQDPTKGFREMLEKMRAQGVPESELKKFEQMIKGAGAQKP